MSRFEGSVCILSYAAERGAFICLTQQEIEKASQYFMQGLEFFLLPSEDLNLGPPD